MWLEFIHLGEVNASFIFSKLNINSLYEFVIVILKKQQFEVLAGEKGV